MSLICVFFVSFASMQVTFACRDMQKRPTYSQKRLVSFACMQFTFVKTHKKELGKRALLRAYRIFCVYIDLFCVFSGLFCGCLCLFCVYIGLIQERSLAIGLSCVHIYIFFLIQVSFACKQVLLGVWQQVSVVCVVFGVYMGLFCVYQRLFYDTAWEF